MNDKSKMALAFLAGAGLIHLVAYGAYKRREEALKGFFSAADLHLKIIRSFTKHSDSAVLAQVIEDVEFDWVVLGLDIKE